MEQLVTGNTESFLMVEMTEEEFDRYVMSDLTAEEFVSEERCKEPCAT